MKLSLEIHWFFPSFGYSTKNKSKVKKKQNENIKSDTKPGINSVWNKPWPKLLHQKLALNKGILKMWC